MGIYYSQVKVNMSKTELPTFPPESPTITLVKNHFTESFSLCGSRLELAKKGIWRPHI